jgi:hypothetical protein
VATAALGLLILSCLGTGIASAKQQHDDQVRKDRIAAEKRAADAYVKAVRPIADRVFDAVQPIDNAIDAFGNPRPGVGIGLRDVVTKGGAAAELAAVREALAAKQTPRTHRAASAHLAEALGELSKAVAAMDHSVRAPDTDACESCGAEDELRVAETSWASALGDLGAAPPMSAPGPDGGSPEGPTRPTRGGFIHASDLACATSSVALSGLPERDDVDAVRFNFPREAAILRSSVTALRKIKLPSNSAPLARRLDVDLRSATGLAATLDQLSSALKTGNAARYHSALAVLDTELKAMDKLGSTYRSLGATSCASFFGTPDKKSSRKPLRA